MQTLNSSSFHDSLEDIIHNTLQHMQHKAERLLNPSHHHLSTEAKKRLRWLYVVYEEQQGNITRSANKIGVSRQWLSSLKSVFERNNRDPRSLEPESRAPHDTNNRKRIPKEVEDTIIRVRDETPGWGKEKIARILKRV